MWRPAVRAGTSWETTCRPFGELGAAAPANGGESTMTIVHTTVTRAKPGRLHDAIAAGVEANKLFERIGAPDSRLLMAQVAGEQTGSGVFVTEFASGEDWGAFTDALLGDTELQAFGDRFEGEGSPIVMESTSTGVVLDLGRSGSTAHGPVVQSYVTRPTSGGGAAMLELTNAAFDFLEANGATNCRVMLLQNAGLMTDCMVASWELESLKALGRLADAWMSPAGQKISERAASGDGGSTTISSGVYLEVPL